MKWISLFSISLVMLAFNPARAAKITDTPSVARHKEASVTLSSSEERKAFLELTGRDFSKLSESSLYSELIASYQTKNELQFFAQLDVFLSKYKKGSFADNALFLAGRLALEKKNYAKAIYYFDKVIHKYPSSNKVVSAELSKGIAYQRMSLHPLALQVFERIKKKYPGSPEFYRAESEAKLIRVN
jgi:TolA-binding protein